MHISRHWRRADHCSGTVVSKHIASKKTLEILLVRHRSSSTEISIQRPAFEKEYHIGCRNRDSQSYNTTAGAIIHSKYNVTLPTRIVSHNGSEISRPYARLFSYICTTENSSTSNKLRQFNK